MKLQVGDYARVVLQPSPWESSGETEQDLFDLVGHVGLVVEVIDGESLALLRFPELREENSTGQRNVELSALEFVSRPNAELPRVMVEG